MIKYNHVHAAHKEDLFLEIKFTLYVVHSVLLLKAKVAITRCNSFIWVAPHGARYFRAYVMARKLFSPLTNSMNSCSLN